MSKATHTPGPWHWVNSVTDEPFDFSAEWDDRGTPSLRTVVERKRNPDSTWNLPDWILDAAPMQYGNDASNARLIAAAPELLEALQNIEASTHDAMTAALARVAISKATGGQQ